MPDNTAWIPALLFLVPIIIVILAAYGAIRCSEWYGAWSTHRRQKRHKRKSSEFESSADSTESAQSADLEAGSNRPVLASTL